MKNKFKALSDKMKVLSDPKRIAIIEMLDSPKMVKDIMIPLKIEPTLGSHHLAVLVLAGYISVTKEGTKKICSKTEKCPDIKEICRIFKV